MDGAYRVSHDVHTAAICIARYPLWTDDAEVGRVADGPLSAGLRSKPKEKRQRYSSRTIYRWKDLAAIAASSIIALSRHQWH